MAKTQRVNNDYTWLPLPHVKQLMSGLDVKRKKKQQPFQTMEIQNFWGQSMMGISKVAGVGGSGKLGSKQETQKKGGKKKTFWVYGFIHKTLENKEITTK